MKRLYGNVYRVSYTSRYMYVRLGSPKRPIDPYFRVELFSTYIKLQFETIHYWVESFRRTFVV
jgi:hypothetical protein